MKIGDIEYTRHSNAATAAANSSVRTLISFALGIRIRPLLTRVQAFMNDAQAATGGFGIYLENGESIGTGLTLQGLADDGRAHPLHIMDNALATNGMGWTFPFESLWWKILLPNVRIHWVSTVLAVSRMQVTLHYRFAELTPDEITEIAAQRAQS